MQGSGFGVPNWDFQGSTMVTSNYIRLTPDDRSRQGALWNKVIYHLDSYHININRTKTNICTYLTVNVTDAPTCPELGGAVELQSDRDDKGLVWGRVLAVVHPGQDGGRPGLRERRPFLRPCYHRYAAKTPIKTATGLFSNFSGHVQ